MTTAQRITPDTVAPCPVCGAYSGASLARPSALLAVCDVLVVRALEAVGKRIVRVERSRFNRFRDRHLMWHEAHTMWALDPERDALMMDKGLLGAWDVVPALLDNHGCCGITSAQVTRMLDSYVRDMLITGVTHNITELRYRFEDRLGIPLDEPDPYVPPETPDAAH